MPVRREVKAYREGLGDLRLHCEPMHKTLTARSWWIGGEVTGNYCSGKMHAAIAAYVTGPGRERLQSALDRTEKMREAGKKHLADTTKHVNDLEKMYAAHEHDLSDIFAEIDNIIENGDDETE